MKGNLSVVSNPQKSVGKYKVIPGFPRPYIRIEGEATGSTNITNSELAYLGYEAGLGVGKTGITYLGGDNSVLRNNNIHDLYFAFYSSGVGDILLRIIMSIIMDTMVLTRIQELTI